MKPLLLTTVAACLMTASLPALAAGADTPATAAACLKAAEAKVRQSSAYRNGSVRDKQALLRRADVRQAKALCAAGNVRPRP